MEKRKEKKKKNLPWPPEYIKQFQSAVLEEICWQVSKEEKFKRVSE